MITGNCTNSSNPDLWFPEVPAHRPSIARTEAMAKSVQEALDICSTCPAKAECLAEGMKPENLPHGIFGGMLAGDRLLSTGVKRDNFNVRSQEYEAINLAMRLEPWLRW